MTAPRFDPSKVLLDPWAREVWFPPGHDRDLATRFGVHNAGQGPLAIARPPAPPRAQARRSTRGASRLRDPRPWASPGAKDVDAPGTFAALGAELPRLARLGVTVLELLPVHQNDPQEGSYWGYMPLAFGAVHRQYAAADDAAAELADLVAAAHELDIEVWLDVVYNHTTEVDAATGPTYSQRGLDDASFYRLRADGSYIETTGCGNDLDVTSPVAQDLVRWSLDRLADLGVDGFRFDLAAVLAHDRAFVEELTAWAAGRGVVLIAEPWDAVGAHLLGRAWPSSGWRHWNDAFREVGRGFLRAEPGLVPAMVQRVQGSPDLVDAPLESVNFLACHDGFTLYDLVSYDGKHNDGQRLGRHRRRRVEPLVELRLGGRRRGAGRRPRPAPAPAAQRVVPGDDVARHADGADGRRVRAHAGRQQQRLQPGQRDVVVRLGPRRRVRRPRAVLRRARRPAPPPPRARRSRTGGATRCASSAPAAASTTRSASRSLAWWIGDLYVIANAWWEPLRWTILAAGNWHRVVDTSPTGARRHRPRRRPARRHGLRRRPALRRHPRTPSLTHPTRVRGAARVRDAVQARIRYSGGMRYSGGLSGGR